MKTIPFATQIINKNYAHLEEDQKQNVSTLIILDIMIIGVLIVWSISAWVLNIPELFWLDFISMIGYLVILLAMIFFKLSLEWSRFGIAALGYAITIVPVFYYGLENLFVLHLVIIPLSSLLIFSRKEKAVFKNYLLVNALLYVLMIVWNYTYGAPFEIPPPATQFINLLIIMGSLSISFFLAIFFFFENTRYKDLLANEREKSDRLLLSIFPKSIAQKLRDSNQSVADSFDNITVIFADIVGFTELSSALSPTELVQMLDEVFSEFDNLVEKYSIEKIKTIGDAYMAVCGLPLPDPQHCHKVAEMALDFNQIVKSKFSKKYSLKLRIGIHTGKAVAGVIGNKKFSYDLWGDTVNIASRFEAGGQPECIHITDAVKHSLGDQYIYEDRGEVPIKGKGMMKSFFLMGKKNGPT